MENLTNDYFSQIDVFQKLVTTYGVTFQHNTFVRQTGPRCAQPSLAKFTQYEDFVLK